MSQYSNSHESPIQPHYDTPDVPDIPSNRTRDRPPHLNTTVVGSGCGCGCSCVTCACSEAADANNPRGEAERGTGHTEMDPDSLPSNFSGLTLGASYEDDEEEDIDLLAPATAGPTPGDQTDPMALSIYEWARGSARAEAYNAIDENPFNHFLDQISEDHQDDTDMLFPLEDLDHSISPADSVYVNFPGSGQESVKSSMYSSRTFRSGTTSYYMRGIGSHATSHLELRPEPRFLELTPDPSHRV